MIQPLGKLGTLATLFELQQPDLIRTKNPISTLAFDWLYILLSILLTAGIMMDVWSHTEFGPDQSIFNEYHLLFYGSMGAILFLLVGLHTVNVMNGYRWANALPQGYGLGLFAVLLFALSGAVDLGGHALFGFESDIEALTSPTHLLLFINWFLILFAPVRAMKARVSATGKAPTLLQSLPMLIGFGCMLVCFTIPMMPYFPMGSSPHMLQWLRPDDSYDGYVMGIAGTLLQTIVVMGHVLWLAREFRVPRGGFTVVMVLVGLFLTVIEGWQNPWMMYGIFGIALDVLYAILKPDATRRGAYVGFALLGATAMWAATYGTLAYRFGGSGVFYFSGYNLYGSIAQAVVLSVLVAYFLSMPSAQPQIKTA